MSKFCGCEPQYSYYCANCYEKLQAENKKLREALEYYAGHFINENNNTKLILHDDFGAKARESLKELGEA